MGWSDPNAPSGQYCGLPEDHEGPHAYMTEADIREQIRSSNLCPARACELPSGHAGACGKATLSQAVDEA